MKPLIGYSVTIIQSYTFDVWAKDTEDAIKIAKRVHEIGAHADRKHLASVEYHAEEH